MPTPEEKASFSKRLEIALRRSPEPVKGATELALRFNLRYQGEAISPQTAHKWLGGRAIPANDKLATIAAWLNVDEHWLHYGASPGAKKSTDVASVDNFKPSAETIALAQKISLLPPQQRYLIEDLILQLRQE
ncbi:transcriptional regulator [Undibacterium sp. Xuan67W]|uniref:transcriptional regulator n=1 Tax=Undibacterium sp. Xuan67W TaxID=3413057 RepID=UPI003BF030BF